MEYPLVRQVHQLMHGRGVTVNAKSAHRLIMVLLVLIVCTNCSDDATDPSSPMKGRYSESADFFQGWTRSFEEETDPNDAIQIYRPSDSREFPASWFRNRYAFREDGSCEWLVLHPADAHYMETATWKTSFFGRNEISIINQLGTEVVHFKILDLASDYMKIKSLKYAVPECNYLFGKVDVFFHEEADFDDVYEFVGSLGLDYTYFSKGEVVVRVGVISGDLEELEARLEAAEIIQSVHYTEQSYPYHRDIFIVIFVVNVSTGEAAEFLEGYSELELISAEKNGAYVRFDVPVGQEDEWVSFFLKEPMVENSRKAESFCP